MPSSTEAAGSTNEASAVPRGRARDIALALAVAAGVALCIVQYGANLSLFLDDIAVALNLRDLGLGELLTRQLQYAQIAPAGWLALQKAITGALGFSEYALRLLPFVSAIAASIALALAARRVLSGPAAVLATAWFATSMGLVNYAGQVKQYATDAAAGQLFLLLGLAASGPLDRRRVVLLSAGGALLLLLSQAAVIVGAGIGLALLTEALLRRDRERAIPLAIVLGTWGVVALGVTAWSLAVTRGDLDAYMTRFWSPYFLPFPPEEFADVFRAWQLLRDVFLDPLVFPWVDALAEPLALAAVVGAVSLLRRRRAAALLVLCPLLLVVGVTAAGLLPMSSRVMLFAVPFGLLLMAEGLDVAARAVASLATRGSARWTPVLSAAALALCFVPRLLTLIDFPPPYGWQTPRPFLEALAPRIAPGDVVYVHHEIGKGFVWYGEPVRARSPRIAEGRCATGSPRHYIREVDALRGSGRVWTLLIPNAYGESVLIDDYLDRFAPRIDSIVSEGKRGVYARAVLRDLSTPPAAGDREAERFEIAPSYVRESLGWRCYGFYRNGWSDSAAYALH